MSFPIATLVFGLLLGPAVRAHVECFTGFAAVAEESDGTELVLTTYRELWDELGGTKLSPENVRALAAGEDPFAIPDQPGVDLAQLQRRMRDLEKLVEGRGWLTPNLKRALSEQLRKSSGDVEQATAKVQRAVRRSGAPVKLPVEADFVATPDGTQLVGVAAEKVGPKKNPYPFYVYDLATGTMETRQGPPESLFGLVFSPDRKWLYSAEAGQVLRKVEYRDGQPDWKGAVILGAPGKFNLSAGDAFAMADGKRVVVGRHLDGSPSHVFDGESGTRTKLKLGKKFDAVNNNKDWGGIPGSSDLFMLLDNSKQDRTELHRISVDEAGKVSSQAKINLPPNLERAVYFPDGKSALAYGEGQVAYAGEKQPAREVFNLASLDENIKAVAPHPGGKHVAILIRPRPVRRPRRPSRPSTKSESRVVLVDVTSGSTIATYDIPPNQWFTRIEFTSDGRLAMHEEETRAVVLRPFGP